MPTSDLEKRLRELHNGECGCDKHNLELHCRFYASLLSASAIGAEIEREECARLCFEDDGVMAIQRNGIDICNAIRSRGAK